uniref:TM2 domain-containing protein n=1 Tax=uncultured Erythrobacter sp. TaxID=263913 RepID=UPI00262E2041|nr:TM2 domain-containing protein [uncultured Erythrobacter sp.]
MGFGRKGLPAGEVAAPIAAGFGKAPSAGGEPQMSDDELAAKREAFIASERARKAGLSQPTTFNPADTKGPRSTTFDHLRNDARPASPLASRFQESVPASSPRASIRARKTSMFGPPEKRHVGIAYLCWFVLGQVSLHRFYCGDTKGAIAQVATFGFALLALLTGSIIGMVAFGIWALWIFADLFLIPGILRRFQREHRDMSSSVFA